MSDTNSQSFTIGALAKRLGLKTDTLRAWERRYGVITPQRGATGRREYGAEDLHRLELVCEAVRQGHTIGLVATQENAALEKLVQQGQSQPGGAAAGLIDKLMRAIDRFEDMEFEEELNLAAATLAPWSLINDILVPLLQKVGDAWRRGHLGIVQEHFVSASLRNLMGSLLRVYGPGRGPARVALATLSGERHEFGILLAGMVAASLGIRTCLLGADLPASEVSTAVRRTGVSIVALGATILDDAEATSRRVLELRGMLGKEVQVWIGGSAASEIVRRIDRADVQCIRDLPAFRRTIERL